MNCKLGYIGYVWGISEHGYDLQDSKIYVAMNFVQSLWLKFHSMIRLCSFGLMRMGVKDHVEDGPTGESVCATTSTYQFEEAYSSCAEEDSKGGVPTSASAEETRQLIEGKLGEMGYDSMNTQVRLVESEHGVIASLLDADGVFLEVNPENHAGEEGEVEAEESSEEGEEVERSEVEALRLALQAAEQAAEEARRVLEDEVAELQRKLEREKAKSRDLWKMNCVQLTDFDETLIEKDEEIARLKRQVAGTGSVILHLPVSGVEVQSQMGMWFSDRMRPKGAKHHLW